MITIDLEKSEVTVQQAGIAAQVFPLNSPEAFGIISKAWLRCGWDTKYVYSFAWMGRPIIQLPDDMIRIQEVVYDVKPDVIIETGVAHGGSLIYYATLCKAMDKGRVIGIDIEIRANNRAAIEAHSLYPYITLVEGSSIDDKIVSQVRSQIQPAEKTIVLLDSCHTKAHVGAELEAYSAMVSVGSYIVAMDGIMGEVVGAPRTEPEWAWDNPEAAAIEFVERNPDFIIEEPVLPFNEGTINERVTYWPSAFIKRIR